jgi:hypothetical protein
MWGTRMPHAVRMIRNEHRDFLQVLERLCRLLDRLDERGKQGAVHPQYVQRLNPAQPKSDPAGV